MNTYKNRLSILIFMVIMFHQILCGQNTVDDMQIRSLVGIDTISIIVDLDGDFETTGLTEKMVLVDAELKLRQIGINVDSFNGFSEPYIFIGINVIEVGSHVVFSVEIVLRQLTLLYRDLSFVESLFNHFPFLGKDVAESDTADLELAWKEYNRLILKKYYSEKIILSGTWDQLIIGYSILDDANNNIRDTVKDLMDIFLNDYLTANPK